jgi:hypothetical protein
MCVLSSSMVKVFNFKRGVSKISKRRKREISIYEEGALWAHWNSNTFHGAT